jgi:Tfp pilus assembly protein FimT
MVTNQKTKVYTEHPYFFKKVGKQTRFMNRKTNAHTLIELIVIIAMLGALAFIAIPRLRFSAIYRKQADTDARKIVTDLRRARQLAISDAATNTSGFALNRTGSNFQIVNLSNGTTVPNSTFSTNPKVTCSGGTAFQFGPLGNLKAGSDYQLTVSAQGKNFTISITPATGMVQCIEN